MLSPDPPPTPSASYAGLVQSVDEVRNDMANWSAIEQAAFAHAVALAAPECLRLQQTAYDGDDLLALARLCALGQNWASTYSAARRYTRTATVHRNEAYNLLLQADLHLQKYQELQDHLQELRGAGPVSMAQDDLFLYVMRSLQVSRPGDAIASALLRQPDLLQCIVGCSSDLPSARAEVKAWQNLTLVRESGESKVQDAAAEILASAAQRTARLTPAETTQASLARRQFDSLGKPLPVDASMSRTCGGTRAAACVRLVLVAPADAPTVPALMQAVEELNGRLPPRRTALLLLSDCTAAPKLRAAHTFCRNAPLLAQLGSTQATLLLIVDAEGKLRWSGAATAAWLAPGGAAEVLLDRPAFTEP